MPRYSKYEHIYVKDEVWFEDHIRFHYRKGKRIVLAYMYWILTTKATLSETNFNYFIKYQWPLWETNNRPLPYNNSSNWYDNNRLNYFDESEDGESFW